MCVYHEWMDVCVYHEWMDVCVCVKLSWNPSLGHETNTISAASVHVCVGVSVCVCVCEGVCV